MRPVDNSSYGKLIQLYNELTKLVPEEKTPEKEEKPLIEQVFIRATTKDEGVTISENRKLTFEKKGNPFQRFWIAIFGHKKDYKLEDNMDGIILLFRDVKKELEKGALQDKNIEPLTKLAGNLEEIVKHALDKINKQKTPTNPKKKEAFEVRKRDLNRIQNQLNDFSKMEKVSQIVIAPPVGSTISKPLPQKPTIPSITITSPPPAPSPEQQKLLETAQAEKKQMSLQQFEKLHEEATERIQKSATTNTSPYNVAFCNNLKTRQQEAITAAEQSNIVQLDQMITDATSFLKNIDATLEQGVAYSKRAEATDDALKKLSAIPSLNVKILTQVKETTTEDLQGIFRTTQHLDDIGTSLTAREKLVEKGNQTLQVQHQQLITRIGTLLDITEGYTEELVSPNIAFLTMCSDALRKQKEIIVNTEKKIASGEIETFMGEQLATIEKNIDGIETTFRQLEKIEEDYNAFHFECDQLETQRVFLQASKALSADTANQMKKALDKIRSQWTTTYNEIVPTLLKNDITKEVLETATETLSNTTKKLQAELKELHTTMNESVDKRKETKVKEWQMVINDMKGTAISKIHGSELWDFLGQCIEVYTRDPMTTEKVISSIFNNLAKPRTTNALSKDLFTLAIMEDEYKTCKEQLSALPKEVSNLEIQLQMLRDNIGNKSTKNTVDEVIFSLAGSKGTDEEIFGAVTKALQQRATDISLFQDLKKDIEKGVTATVLSKEEVVTPAVAIAVSVEEPTISATTSSTETELEQGLSKLKTVVLEKPLLRSLFKTFIDKTEQEMAKMTQEQKLKALQDINKIIPKPTEEKTVQSLSHTWERMIQNKNKQNSLLLQIKENMKRVDKAYRFVKNPNIGHPSMKQSQLDQACGSVKTDLNVLENALQDLEAPDVDNTSQLTDIDTILQVIEKDYPEKQKRLESIITQLDELELKFQKNMATYNKKFPTPPDTYTTQYITTYYKREKK